MNHCVPDFEMEEDDSKTLPAGLSRQKKSALHEEELVELLWQNGQVVMHSQNQRSPKKSPQPKFPIEHAVIPAGRSTAEEIRSSVTMEANQLFMQEDEMASWLHYPLDDSFDQDFCADLLYTSPSGTFAPSSRITQTPEDIRQKNKTPAATRPPIPPPARDTELDSASKFSHFMHFSRPKMRSESQPLVSDKTARESTDVGSSETPAAEPGSRLSHGARSSAPVSSGNLWCGSISGDAATSDIGKELVTSEPIMTSSSGGSGGSGEPPLKDDRKRKTIEADDTDCHSEDVEFESVPKKQLRGSTSGRRARAAEVHNLSERRRRDRINEKMKALQELIPRCNKSDKASMLDEAIEYLKSLQLQVQMMSMGCSMVPMMFPGVQPYMSPMGMGMGMDMGLSRPMMPFPSVLAGSGMPNPASPAHLGPRLPMPAFHLPPVSTLNLSRMQATNQSDPASNSIGLPGPNQLQVPNFSDPYQRYLGLHQMQVPPPQSQGMAQPSTSKGVDTLENHQSESSNGPAKH